MADDKKKDGDEAEAKGGKSKLVLVLVITNVLVLAGVGAAVFFMMTQPAAGAGAEAPAQEPSHLGPLVEITPLVVNLSDEDGSHFLRAAFQLEVTDPERQPDVEARLVPMRSAIMLYLSSLQRDDTVGQENLTTIIDRIRELANEQAGAELVRNVYLTDFVVQ